LAVFARQLLINVRVVAKIIVYEEKNYCSVYPSPSSKWLNGKCPSATHIKLDLNEATQKINPLKASKRSNKKA